jgi:hypothetical protein
MFVTINDRLLNITDVQMARPTEASDTEKIDGVRVYFISGGHTVIRDVTVQMVDAVLSEAAKSLAAH